MDTWERKLLIVVPINTKEKKIRRKMDVAIFIVVVVCIVVVMHKDLSLWQKGPINF
jgi:hypothetical protein